MQGLAKECGEEADGARRSSEKVFEEDI